MSFGASAALAQSPEPYPLGAEIALTEMAGTAVEPGAGITAIFAIDSTGGTLSGSGGCNSYSATWDSDGATLTVGPIAATLMACDPTTDALESQYLGLLQAAATWSLEGTVVTVVSADGSTLVFGGGDEASALVGEWQLVTFGGTPVPGGIVATAIFGEDGSLTGSGGCNTFSGTYTVDGASLSVGPLAATRMACEATGEIEPAYLDMLQTATGWSVDGGTLTIDSTFPLVFSNGTAPEGSLTGQAWYLATMDGAAVDPSLGTSATFAEDGTVSGSGGCNQYNAGYAADGTSISIGPIAATRMACEPAVSTAENEFFTAMEAAVGYVVSGDTLVISMGDGSVLEFTTGVAPTPSAAPTAGASAAPTAGASSIATGGIVGSWQMTEFAGQSLPGGLLDISITFADDGTFTGNGGCNEYSGTWTLTGTTIALKDFVPGTENTTCDITTKGLEDAFFSLVPFLDTAELTDGSLSIVSALAGNTGFTFAPAS